MSIARRIIGRRDVSYKVAFHHKPAHEGGQIFFKSCIHMEATISSESSQVCCITVSVCTPIVSKRLHSMHEREEQRCCCQEHVACRRREGGNRGRGSVGRGRTFLPLTFPSAFLLLSPTYAQSSPRDMQGLKAGACLGNIIFHLQSCAWTVDDLS